jgi:anti-sigma regulatory factor (Ser/Thr protein kinase)
VPLRLEGRVIGTLAFGRTDSDPQHGYDDDDVALASEIARRVTPAVAHALRYEREREMVTVLQHSLLPESIPSSELVATEARYLSGTQGLRVGGDWYDAIQFDDGRMLLVIGDVVGHGVRAATLMGQLRTAVRVGWLESTRPGQLLTRLNRFLTGAGPGAMATCLLILLDPATGMVEWSSAGHPPAVLRDASGSATFLDGGLGPPLGVVELMSYPEAAIRAEPGSRIVMFTDGLFERRGVPIDDMLDLVRDCVAAASDPLRNLCDDLIAQLIGSRPLVDDAAILAVELVRPAAVFEHSLRHARQLAGLRAHLRAWLGASGVDAVASSDLVLAASELAANAIEHGYSGTGSGVVAVRAKFEEDAVALTVEDSGQWRAPADAGSDRGRGLPIVRALSDDLVMEVTQRGTSARVLVRPSAASERRQATG